MQCPGNLIVLLQSWTTSQYFGKPELANGSLHVADLSLSGSRSLDPLRWLTTDTAHHVRMRKCLGRPLLGLGGEGGGDWLRDARVKRRGATRDDEIAVRLVAGAGTAIAVTSPWPLKRRVSVQRGRHVVFSVLCTFISGFALVWIR